MKIHSNLNTVDDSQSVQPFADLDTRSSRKELLDSQVSWEFDHKVGVVELPGPILWTPRSQLHGSAGLRYTKLEWSLLKRKEICRTYYIV